MEKFNLWKIVLVIGILLSLVAFILGWIGFGVPDWHAFQRYNGSITEYYGLWAYCQEQTLFSTTVCKRWSTAADVLFDGNRPSFVKTTEGLITTGMILLSLGLAIAILAAILPLLAYAAALLAFMAFIFLVVGLPIFAKKSDNFSASRGEVNYYKRYGFWLIVPTIILEFLAMLLFVGVGFLYKKFGYGNFASGFHMNKQAYGGRKVLGQPYRMNTSGFMGGMGPQGPPYGLGDLLVSSYLSPKLPLRSEPSLLAEYLASRRLQNPSPIIVRSAGPGILPQPSILAAAPSAPIQNVTPSYLRAEQPYGPPFAPIINLSGQTLVGPIQRIS